MSDPLYHTAAWQKCREAILQRDNWLCQRCKSKGKLTAAEVVHHVKHLDKHPELALEESNLVAVCKLCHEKIHRTKAGKEPVTRRARVIKG